MIHLAVPMPAICALERWWHTRTTYQSCEERISLRSRPATCVVIPSRHPSSSRLGIWGIVGLGYQRSGISTCDDIPPPRAATISHARFNSKARRHWHFHFERRFLLQQSLCIYFVLIYKFIFLYATMHQILVGGVAILAVALEFSERSCDACDDHGHDCGSHHHRHCCSHWPLAAGDVCAWLSFAVPF